MDTSDILLLGLFGAGAYAVYHYMNQASPGSSPGYAGQDSQQTPPTQGGSYDPGYGQDNTHDPYANPIMYYPAPTPIQSNSPMGIRYNNPGNLRPGGKEAHYSSMGAGITAALNNLISYYRTHHLNTVSEIINRWAPPSENNTQEYINYVAGHVGVGPNQNINVLNPNTMYDLLSAIFAYENANQFTQYALLRQIVTQKLGAMV